MTVVVNLHRLRIFIVEVCKVERCKITCSIIKKHVLRTWVGSINPAIVWTSVPFIDCSVKLQSWIRALPRTKINLVPKITRSNCCALRAVSPPRKLPRSIGHHCFHKLIRYANGVVGVLTRNSLVCFAFIMRIKRCKIKSGDALLNKRQRSLDHVVWQTTVKCALNQDPQTFVIAFI